MGILDWRSELSLLIGDVCQKWIETSGRQTSRFLYNSSHQPLWQQSENFFFGHIMNRVFMPQHGSINSYPHLDRYFVVSPAFFPPNVPHLNFNCIEIVSIERTNKVFGGRVWPEVRDVGVAIDNNCMHLSCNFLASNHRVELWAGAKKCAVCCVHANNYGPTQQWHKKYGPLLSNNRHKAKT